MSESTTPRTDALEEQPDCGPITFAEDALALCREMERENEQLRAALQFIANYGGSTQCAESGTLSCNGSWCAEQARAALKA